MSAGPIVRAVTEATDILENSDSWKICLPFNGALRNSVFRVLTDAQREWSAALSFRRWRTLKDDREKMSNHPKRSTAKRFPKPSPKPSEVRAAREAVGLTQTQAGEMIYSTLRTWQNWENEDPKENRPMHPGLFELFLIKTGQKKLEA